MMKAVGYLNAGGLSRLDALIDFDLPIPKPSPNDLRKRLVQQHQKVA